MGFVSEYFEVAKDVITSPTEFFENENRRDGFGYPLKFAAFSLLISGLFSGLRTIIFGPGTETAVGAPVLAAVSAFATPVIGVIALEFSAVLVHNFVELFGGDNGYGNTLATLAYGTSLGALGSVLGLVPIVGVLAGLVLGIYGIYVQSKGLSKFQGLDFGKSVLALLLPSIIIAVLVFGSVIVVLGTSFTSLAA